jgi:hypothetical protein
MMLDYNDWSTRLNALRCKLLGRADLGRWADATAFDDWEERTRIIAGMVPAGANVIEFGAGGRLLERHLDPSCRYTPSDIVDRGPGTIILDLNQRRLPDLSAQQFDMALFAGVLEYIADLRSFLMWLARQAPCCIASYGCATSRPRSLARVRESFRRAGAGWANTLTEGEILQFFANAGYGLEEAVDWRTPEGDERIFRFKLFR